MDTTNAGKLRASVRSKEVMCCHCQSTKPDLIEGGSKEYEGVEGSACVSVVHAFIAVFLIA